MKSLPRISIIVPCYNEEAVFVSTHQQLLSLLDKLKSLKIIKEDSFITYVDDGSEDNTWHLIERASTQSSGEVSGIKLGHNSGHQNALLAGVENIVNYCDAAITLDADLQDDIDVIPEMINKFEEGAEIIYGVRVSRDNDTWFERTSAKVFYKTIASMGVETIYNHADFRLMSSRALKELLKYKENDIFLRGIVPKIGLKHNIVSYDRKAREAGVTKYPFKKKISFAIGGITSFSIKPVRMVFLLGIVFLLISLFILIYSLIRYFTRNTIEGWTSLILSIWFCTGSLLLSLGIIGEYVGKIFLEVKERPRYVIEKKVGF